MSKFKPIQKAKNKKMRTAQPNSAQEKEALDSINVKFVLSDGTEHICGTTRTNPSFVSLIPSVPAGAENALVYLAGALDNTFTRSDGIVFPKNLK
jgi:hypothetical protein